MNCERYDLISAFLYDLFCTCLKVRFGSGPSRLVSFFYDFNFFGMNQMEDFILQIRLFLF